MYKAMTDRTFQEAYDRAQSSYNNNDWQALSPHQVTEAIYRELRAIDAERNQNPRRALVEPMVKEFPDDKSPTGSLLRTGDAVRVRLHD
jgi:hypothetical protein